MKHLLIPQKPLISLSLTPKKKNDNKIDPTNPDPAPAKATKAASVGIMIGDEMLAIGTGLDLWIETTSSNGCNGSWSPCVVRAILS